MEVIVLAHSFPNWKGLNKLGYTTKSLDKAHLNLFSPLALIASLQGIKDDTYNPWKDKVEFDLQNHFTITFGVTCDKATASIILASESVTKKSLIVDGEPSFLVLTGTLLDWRIAITMMERNAVYARIAMLFRKTDLRNLFDGV